MLLLALAGCGSVVFIDPDAQLKSTLRMTRSDLIRIDHDPNLYLVLELPRSSLPEPFNLALRGPEGLTAVPAEAELIRSVATSSATALAFIAPPTSSAARSLRLSFPGLHHSTERSLSALRVGPYSLQAQASPTNDAILVEIGDPLSRRLFQTGARADRSFDAIADVCAETPGATDPRWLRLGGTRGRLPTTFAAGATERCVYIRPSAPAGGPAVAAQMVPARAQLEVYEHQYVPPVEVAPIAFGLIFDLEIPVEARCGAAKELVRAALIDAARTAIEHEDPRPEIVELPSVEVAVKDGVPCRQENERHFDPEEHAARLIAALEDRVGAGRRARILLVYVSNLDLPLPSGLASEIFSLRGKLDSRPGLAQLLLGIGPATAVGSISPELTIDYGASNEPSFRAAIKDRLSPLWPFKTLLHTRATVVPLVDASQQGRFQYFQVCSSSHEIEPVSEQEIGSVLVPQAGVPSYRVGLPDEVLVAASELLVPSVSVRWVGCRAFCDHPGPRGTGEWIDQGGCL